MKLRTALITGALIVSTIGVAACVQPPPNINVPIPNPCDIICGHPNPTTTVAGRPAAFDCTVLLHFPDQVAYGFAIGFWEPILGHEDANWNAFMANCATQPALVVVKIDKAPNLPAQNPKVLVHLLKPEYMQLNPPNPFPMARRARYLATTIDDRTMWHDAFLLGTWNAVR